MLQLKQVLTCYQTISCTVKISPIWSICFNSLISFAYLTVKKRPYFLIFFFFLNLQVDFSANEGRPIKKLLTTFMDLTTLSNLIGYYYEISNLGSFHAVAQAIRERQVKELNEDGCVQARLIKKMVHRREVPE